MTTAANNIDLIFTEWKASLKTRDRSKDAVFGNFEDLFEKLRSSGASFEEAHSLLPKAIKAHQPTPGLARSIYKNLKASHKTSDSEKDWIDQWNQDIADKATNAFFSSFPLPKNKDDDDEPKVYGNMSAKEYRAQRRYADQFPILNVEELERRIQVDTYNPLDDVDTILSGKD